MHAFRLLGQLECWQVQLVAAIARVQLEGWLEVWAPLMWVESHASKHYTVHRGGTVMPLLASG